MQSANFDSVNLKFLNQDVLENCFSQIRSNGYANTTPNPEQFQVAFKLLLIFNLPLRHSICSNYIKNNEGATMALLQLMNISKVMKEINDKEETEEMENTEGIILIPTNNELIIDPQIIENIVARNKLIVQC